MLLVKKFVANFAGGNTALKLSFPERKLFLREIDDIEKKELKR